MKPCNTGEIVSHTWTVAVDIFYFSLHRIIDNNPLFTGNQNLFQIIKIWPQNVSYLEIDFNFPVMWVYNYVENIFSIRKFSN